MILLGLICGSFLNVVIHRLPRGESIVHPRSHCPACQGPIPLFLNIPIISYLLLLGKCRQCRAPIPIRYPLVEAFTAFSFWLAYRSFAPESLLFTIAAIAFIMIMIPLGLIDLSHMILPDSLTLGGGILFFIFAFFHPEYPGQFYVLIATGLGAAALFFLLYLFYLKVRKIEGLGLGDVKMMLPLGFFLGPWGLVITVFMGSILGLIVGMFFIVFKKKNLKFSLPFGTFLAISAYITLFLKGLLLFWLSTFLAV